MSHNTFILKHEPVPPLYRAEYNLALDEWVVYEGKFIHARFGGNIAAARFTAQACNEKRERALARDVLVIIPKPSAVFQN